jgi:hypothetical protein
MGETTDQIESRIEDNREDLKSNLQELESRVKSATDWRRYFKEHTGAMIAVAFGGGALLSTMIGGRRRDVPSTPAVTSGSSARSWTAGPKDKVFENLDTIKSALIGVAATRFKGMLGEVVPGFTEHLAKAESDRNPGSTH